MSQVRTLTKNDQSLLALTLKNAGIKARLRRFPTLLRVCFVGSWESVASVLNENGFRTAAGEQFTRRSFNDINGEVFVRFMEA